MFFVLLVKVPVVIFFIINSIYICTDMIALLLFLETLQQMQQMLKDTKHNRKEINELMKFEEKKSKMMAREIKKLTGTEY